MIVWKPAEENEKFVCSDLAVYSWTMQERKSLKDLENPLHYQARKKIDRYKKFGYSTGNCNACWEKSSVHEIIAECFKIIHDYPPINYFKVIFEFGKIEELECFRKYLFKIEPYYNKNYDECATFSEFVKLKYDMEL